MQYVSWRFPPRTANAATGRPPTADQRTSSTCDSTDAAERRPVRGRYWHTVPGARKTFRVIALDCATPFTL